MLDHDFDQMLRRSAPASVGDDPAVRAQLADIAADTRADANVGRRRRMRRIAWLAPVVLVPAMGIALTGGGDPRLTPDFTIPVTYTTGSGATVSCSVEFFNGEEHYVEVSFAGVAYLESQDWTGIGQRIHDEAVRLIDARDPVVFAPDDTTGGEPGADVIEWRAWSLAESSLVEGSIPDGVMAAGDHFGSDSDCTGELR